MIVAQLQRNFLMETYIIRMCHQSKCKLMKFLLIFYAKIGNGLHWLRDSSIFHFSSFLPACAQAIKHRLNLVHVTHRSGSELHTPHTLKSYATKSISTYPAIVCIQHMANIHQNQTIRVRASVNTQVTQIILSDKIRVYLAACVLRFRLTPALLLIAHGATVTHTWTDVFPWFCSHINKYETTWIRHI